MQVKDEEHIHKALGYVAADLEHLEDCILELAKDPDFARLFIEALGATASLL